MAKMDNTPEKSRVRVAPEGSLRLIVSLHSNIFSEFPLCCSSLQVAFNRLSALLLCVTVCYLLSFMTTGVRINFQIIFTLRFDQDMTLAVYISCIGIINSRVGYVQQLPNITYNKTPI
jgi:hypothetical protein